MDWITERVDVMLEEHIGRAGRFSFEQEPDEDRNRGKRRRILLMKTYNVQHHQNFDSFEYL